MLVEDVQYDRKYCVEHPQTLFVFADNTDRSSGQNQISDSSWYSKKYGCGHKYPNITTAQVRGLPNCYPISTQRWYHPGHKGKNGQWKDDDFDEFKKVIDDEINDIERQLRSGMYRQIIFCSSIVNGHISDISLNRTPKLYKYLVSKLNYITNTYIHKSLF